MTFTESVKTCFIKYIDFSGRASRSEYWYFALFTAILVICANAIDATIAGVPFSEYDISGTLTYGIIIILFIPQLAVTVRRLHDVNRSGWWYLIHLTIIGIIPLFYWMIKKSDLGPNKFDNNPLENKV